MQPKSVSRMRTAQSWRRAHSACRRSAVSGGSREIAAWRSGPEHIGQPPFRVVDDRRHVSRYVEKTERVDCYLPDSTGQLPDSAAPAEGRTHAGMTERALVPRYRFAMTKSMTLPTPPAARRSGKPAQPVRGLPGRRKHPDDEGFLAQPAGNRCQSRIAVDRLGSKPLAEITTRHASAASRREHACGWCHSGAAGEALEPRFRVQPSAAALLWPRARLANS